jgi:hypothetical protein
VLVHFNQSSPIWMPPSRQVGNRWHQLTYCKNAIHKKTWIDFNQLSTIFPLLVDELYITTTLWWLDTGPWP